MSVFLRCCPNQAPVCGGGLFSNGHHGYRTEPAETIHAQRGSTGVTIGDIDDASRRIQSQHRFCPHAKAGDHDEQGFVVVEPIFEATYFPPDNDGGKEAKSIVGFVGCLFPDAARKTLHQVQIEAYVKAKHEAWEDDNNIPTFANFLEKEGPAIQERYQAACGDRPSDQPA